MTQLLRDRRRDWLDALAEEVKREGLRKVAALLGRSKSCISGVLSGTYKACRGGCIHFRRS